MLRAERKYGLLLVWLVMFLLLAMPLYAQSILTQAVSGTGFVVSSDGYIITNRHVINGATDISVTIGSKEYEARVVGSLSDNDIALLKVDAHGLPVVMLGDSDNVAIGDTVYAIGCPAGVCGTITQGRVANLGISSKTDEGTTLHNLIMSDLTTTHGSSGGPLLNDRAEVIGITTAGIVVQGETTGFGVSIPIDQAIPLLQRVPGFSTSQMGRATTVLTLDGIRRSVGPDTAFVQAEIQRPLSDLLPKDVLGRSLESGCTKAAGGFAGFPKCEEGGSPAKIWSVSLLRNLHNRHLHGKAVADAWNETITADTTEDIVIAVFDCSSVSDALRALTYLKSPTTWDFVDPYADSVNLLYTPFDFSKTWANSDLKESHVLSSSSQQIGTVAMNTRVTFYTSDTWSNCSLNPSSTKIMTYLELWGFTTFAIDNRVFLIVNYSMIYGPEYQACEGSTLPGGSILWVNIPYEWQQIGHSFVFSSGGKRLFTINYNPFLDNLDGVLRAVFQVLAK